MEKAAGAHGFTEDYWRDNYAEAEDMDGIGNAKNHADYLAALFSVELIDISTVIDLGFGLGHLFKQVLGQFIPHLAVGIEPSSYAFSAAQSMELRPVESTQLELFQLDLVSWALSNKKIHQRVFDLGLCTSVFQYLSEEEIDCVLPIMAKRMKYLYFSVPTDIELDRQVEEVEFHDAYALRRTRQWYQEKISKHFTFVSMRLLESKHFFQEDDTLFRDLLFRY